MATKYIHKTYNVFVSVVCGRNTVEDPTIPRHIPTFSRKDSGLFQCGCDGGAQTYLAITWLELKWGESVFTGQSDILTHEGFSTDEARGF